ncbi:response regulator [Marinactinospora thermotolerans]|uniref:Response regulator containing a CheY-like receiver domain and an HD-GYP domain n=1 Tax=Marinactinospora thermotolerans DSM 45154 TaxID=1122192 RepID=A0A1T4TB50_9ACTN|nr:response regulator [Marinactinospora thermotolerans]SKA37561.1 Response regulator containing a CheY-like receiver domain and an HD-GYP domain [Marinactinospora thermotolerans DSM 45154]
MPHKANILLVDDRDDNLTTLEAILTSLDQNLVRASSGEAALKALLEDDFAVILLDVMMPGMDGFETAAHIKQREKTKDIPIIFLTGADIDRHQVFRGYASRSIDYLTKPFDPWVLRAKVEVFVDLYHTKRRLQEQSRMLQRELGAEVDGPVRSVVTRLSERTAEVSEGVERVRERVLATDADGRTAAALRDLDRSVARLAEFVSALRGSS